MALGRLDITNVRNLDATRLRELADTNIFFGNNGSGKTSVLESVFLLGMARSFRSGSLKSLITHGQSQCAVYGELQQGEDKAVVTSMGVSRDREGGLEARVGAQSVRSAAELAEQLPLQVINAESFNLLIGAPEHRRQFLDWGVFHVEHNFHTHWQRFQRALKQRNSLLRRGRVSVAELEPWNQELCESGELVDQQRARYFEQMERAFQTLISRLSGELVDLEIRYRRGWDRNSSLASSLAATVDTDQQQGFTHVGPQRADLKLITSGLNAAEVLSRGQQKQVVCALKLAQGQMLADKRRRACVYLVDDLPAELDKIHCRLVAEMLAELETQVFITCVESEEIADVWPQTDVGTSIQMFHVEQGCIGAVAPV